MRPSLFERLIFLSYISVAVVVVVVLLSIHNNLGDDVNKHGA